MATSSFEKKYPIHWKVWHNSDEELDALLATGDHNIEQLDPRGRTPLLLAVTLGHLESARVLLKYNANASAENRDTWTVLQEAVCTGDPELVHMILQHRDVQRYTQRTEGVPGLLKKLTEAPDFYVEMKWEFTSWVPLVSRMCPRDTYKIWKSGANVRIDTTLLGFDQMSWQRGKRSYVFKGGVDSATVMEIDHDVHHVYTETMRVLPDANDVSLLIPSQDTVAHKLTSPVITTYVDTENISFERNKSGIWGWRSDKVENINDYTCKVFNASNVQLITKTRTDHMTEKDKERMKKQGSARSPLDSFLGLAEQHESSKAVTNGHKEDAAAGGTSCQSVTNNPSKIEPEEYFNESFDLKGKDIGRPKDLSTKTQKFKATLWLAEEFPLSLPEQVVPIIDLMAASNAHFRKLRDFITLQLPAGFPVKIEIPLFHVLNARITFGNIFASETPAEFVSCNRSDGPVNDSESTSERVDSDSASLLPQQSQQLCCVVEDACFDVPSTYSVTGESVRDRANGRDEDDDLLQFAIQQSLMAAGQEDDQVTFYEALNRGGRPLPAAPEGRGREISAATRQLLAEEDRQLQRALEASIMSCNLPNTSDNPQIIPTSQDPTDPASNATDTDASQQAPPSPTNGAASDLDEQLRVAMEMSRKQQEEDEKRRKEEEEELNKILELSLIEK